MKDIKPGEWIPKELQLPDSIEAIELGRPPKQLGMFDQQRDLSRQAVVERLCGIDDVTTASRLRRRSHAR